ncbi:RNA exonuclease 4 [Denticeps clupeoides]|uniref:RNA exonuclease 4 n=1 Tax=Denticeps clupeoides TaxID=299321 RepID=A0AAY4AES4_9TELE|nr:RNA exonuclease 4 [Denticeps clupeoides]
MSKDSAKVSHSAAHSNKPDSAGNRKKKRKKFWKHTEKKPAARDAKKPCLPPKDAEGFSANWKALLESLKSKADVKSRQTEPQQKQENSQQPLTAHKKTWKDIKKTCRIPEDCKHSPEKTEDSPVDLQNGTSPGERKAKKRKAEKLNGKNDRFGHKKKTVEVEQKQPTEEDIWFDDVDPDDIEAAVGAEAADIVRKRTGVKMADAQSVERVLMKEHAFEGLTRAVAMDCEMVGVGQDGQDSILARVSIVNQFGKCIYDKYVRPTEHVTDYRTAVSGIRPENIMTGEDVRKVQKDVAEILNGRILVGHAIHNDLKILLLDHPKKKIRDTQKYKPFKSIVKSGRPSLKLLCSKILNVRVQEGEHSSVQDAQATMRLYTMEKKEWERSIKASKSKETCVKKS